MEQTVETSTVQKDLQADQAIDFKMVTFSLAGKDYAIDIMQVKEISKISRFTFVPNSAPFVRGVYNLRGDIISVIDLRLFFNLPAAEQEGAGGENIIILRLEEHVLAVVVDEIDKVVGISKESIQPPHPIFGDINIKYISGVVEEHGRLYVILDVERILGTGDRSRTKEQNAFSSSLPEIKQAEQTSAGGAAAPVSEGQMEVDLGFIKETLVTFLAFYAGPMNMEWMRSRYISWKKQRGDKIQLTSEKDAQDFLAPFWSPFSGAFWSSDYADKVAALLPPGHTGNFQVWNPGCGMGHEACSLACTIKKTLPKVHLRILAHDKDLIRVSGAPGLRPPENAGEPFSSFTAEGARETVFNKEITDALLFEYHDITHDNTLPKLDMVVARDTLCYLPEESCRALFNTLDDVMKPGSLLLLGSNEEPINPELWERIENSGVVAYKKR
ncbi:MAG: chemotaxis protein CheR [Spirochaetales bacterium]|nr:MAG: chemotaxis protein CheR [Spirochaetales bacterium]